MSCSHLQLWAKLSDELGVQKSQEALANQPLLTELAELEGASLIVAV